MSDQLRDEFAAFRAASVAQTLPPGVPAIKRTLMRRHARQAAVLATAAVAVAVWAFLPGGSTQRPAPTSPSSAPAVTPASSPSPSRPPVPPSPSGTPSLPHQHSSTSSTASTSASSTRTPGSGTPTCGPFNRWPESGLITGDGPDNFSMTGELLTDCPNARLDITRAVYTGTGKTLSRYSSVTRTLSAAHPTTTMPAGAQPTSGCDTVFVVTVLGSGLPHTVTNLVPQLISKGNDDPADLYFGNRGFEVIETSWTQPC